MDKAIETQTRLERLSKRPISNGEANMVVVTIGELRANHIVFRSGGHVCGLHFILIEVNYKAWVCCLAPGEVTRVNSAN